MHVSLIPLSATELTEFLEMQVAEFAREKVLAGHWAETEARRNSRKSILQLIGSNPSERGHRFLKGVDDRGTRIGWIWIGPIPDAPPNDPGKWLYQITVEERLRGRGFGRSMMEAVERLLAEEGVDALNLNVFAWNMVARSLYDSAGYVVVSETPTDAHMRKALGP